MLIHSHLTGSFLVLTSYAKECSRIGLHYRDGWSVDTTRASFLGVTGHWMDVTGGKWKLRAEVIGFHGVSGEHSGENLGRYFVGVCERVGIIDAKKSKVLLITYYLT
jgi:hypothetical protein